MENSRLKKLKTKKSLAGILLVIAVVILAGIIKIGSTDKLKGTIKVTNAYLSNVTTKLSANISDISGTGPVTSNGYDEVSYELKYTLSESNQDRDVIINGSLDSDSGYASFKRIVGDNITCTLSDNDRKIEIVIRNVPSNTEITTNIPIVINGAPNGYRVNPTFKIKESTAENYTDVYTNPIEVSTNSLRGTVKNENGDSVSNVIVSIYKNRRLVKETYTNDNGEYIFSDVPQDTYSVIVNEEIYETVDYSNVTINGDSSLDLFVKRVYPFTLETHKYITKVDVNNLGNLISKTYNNISLVNFPVKRLNNLSGKVYYKIVVENVGQKDGIVSVVKDELPSFMTFNEEENSGFELIDGIIYDRNLEGVELLPGQRVEDTLVLNISNTSEAREYLNRVTVTGDIYEHVVYILDGNVYKELDVLEGEKLDRISDPGNNFSGWYTDSEYTNKYNYNNPVIKNLILYGKTGQKYTVEFYDKDPEDGDEEFYTSDEVNGGDPVDEPNDHPEHTGYDFDYWCKTDFTEYNFREPVNSNLKLISCYTIKKYDVNFYDYSDTLEKNIKVEYKKLIDQTEAPTFDETGYTFICWSRDKTNCFDFTTPVVETIDLYPIHEILTNAVIFNDENRVTTIDSVPYGNTVTPIADQGKEGHTFRCWSEDRTNCFDFATPIIRNTTVYAIYDIINYTVNFVDKNPETLVDAPYGTPQTIPYGSTATKPNVDPEHYGYTFKEWTKEDGTTYSFETPVKSNLTLVSKYDINSYPVRFHDGNDVTTVNVVYKNKVTPIDNPTKEHHLFINWLKEDNTVYDFDLPVITELDLYSNYEEILPPVISHVPTMWTNEDVTASLAPNASLTDYTGYSYQYKVGSGNYNTYSDSFNVSENTTITAKASKSNVDSIVVNHEIINIDKLNPSITLFSEGVVNRNSATLNVNSIDNESGINYYEVYVNNVKVGEKHFECYDETTFEGYEACRSTLPAERTSTYTVTGLSSSTTYTVKVKVFDKAGNSVLSGDLEITTTTPQIVARLIGYNNALFEDTIDSTTGDVVTPKEDKYINFESLEEAFDYEDLYDCKNVQCTIQMVTGTNESVQVLEGQNLTLDLNGKVVSGIIPEYTIKNNGSFTLIESTPEGEEPGKLVNNLGIAILNKADSYLTLGDGYSETSVSGSVVSTTKPYVYGEVNGVKNETNGHFTLFDGRIVSPQSQTPGYGAVNGKVTGTEYSYEAVSNPETNGDKTYQVVTLNRLTSPEARINNSVYYGKLAAAMNDANRGTTTLYDDNNAVSIMSEVKAKGGYAFIYDDATGKLVSNSGSQYSERTRSYVVIDLTNEVNDKVLSIDYTPEYGEEVYSETYDFLSGRVNGINGISGPYYIFNVSKVEDYSKNILGDTVAPYRHDTGNYSFELKKGEIYYLDLQFYKYGNDYYYGQERLEELTINDITLSDLDKKTNNFELLSDITTTEYGFYYDPTDGSIRSSNQYVGTTSSAYGAIELDLTDYDPDTYYYIAINYTMESYSQRQNWNESAVAVGKVFYSEQKNSYGGSIGSEFYASAEFDIERVHESMDRSNGNYGGWKTFGPKSTYTSIRGGKKYYLNFAYEKLIRNPENYPSREEFEAAGCLDQLIIHSIDVYKKDNNNTNYLTKNKREIENGITEDLLNNSNGDYTLNSDGTIKTNNGRNTRAYTYATIDLTNDEVGETVQINIKNLKGYVNNYYSGYIDLETDAYDVIDILKYNEDSSYMGVFQKRTINGEEKLIAIQAISDDEYWEDAYITGTYSYGLQGGYEYEVRLYTISPDSTYDTYPNLEIESIKTFKIDEFEGNYFNGVTNSRYFANSTAGTPKSNYRDSFIKLDLTNYEYDQQLYLSPGNGNYSYNYIYITDNNRALTQEELYNNRGNIIAKEYPNDIAIVLEKGKVYYLHFANWGIDYVPGSSNYSYDHINYNNFMSYYEWGMILDGLYMYPILEHPISIGYNKIYTGTLDIANTREESSYIGKRNSTEPVFIENYSTYGFSYNEETGMYDSLNTEAGDIAVKSIKLDLTNSANDKTYSFITNGGGDRNIYGISDGDSAPVIELSSYVELYNDWKYTMPANYYKMSEKPTFNLEKGKVYYLQVLTYNVNSTLSFKLEEMNTNNTTNEFYPIKEIKEFNENVDTVQLLRSVSTTNALEVDPSEEVILDLNGYDLSTSDDYIIKNFGKLTVYDSKYRTKLESYDSDLAEYQEYAGLCDGCSVSEEYKIDHILDYLDEYGIDINNPDPNSIYDFDYTGDVQQFVVPETGLYKLQVWGAQGGYRRASYNGGKGGYSEGIIELKEGETIYVYVGGSGNTGGTDGGFNGGGSRDTYNGGGGASDIRVEGDSLFNRIIVAGGGGSDGATNRSGGYGGGTSGSNTDGGYGDGGNGATQTTPGDGGAFGRGGTGVALDGGYGGAGGGGWFGGGGATPDSSGDDDKGGGGGSGFIYTDPSKLPVSGYSVNEHFLLSGRMLTGNDYAPSPSGSGGIYGKEDNGYAKISLLVGDEIVELRNNLPKTYNIKTEPRLDGMSQMSNGSGTGIIHNNRDALLTLSDVKLDVSSQYGVYNEGTIIAESSPIVNVNTTESVGIYNVGGDIVNNGNLKFNLNANDCSILKEYGAVAIEYSSGVHDLSNVSIEGRRGTGIKINPGTEVRVHSSNVDVNEIDSWGTFCVVGDINNAFDKTSTVNSKLYDKNYAYYFRALSVDDGSYYYADKNYYSRNDGSIYNAGIVTIDEGSTLSGQVTNFGNAALTNGTTFNKVYQNDAYKAYNKPVKTFDNPTISIQNTTVNVQQFVNNGGTINIIEGENETTSISAIDANKPAILNFDKANFNGGLISSMYNMGELTSNNTSYNKLYNLHTVNLGNMCIDYNRLLPEFENGCMVDVKGTATINGGSINNEMLINENDLVLDGVSVPNGIMNRGDLTVKGNSEITGTDKPAIQNIPFLIKYYVSNMYAWDTNKPIAYNFARTSLTIGDNDGNVSGGPIIKSTNDSYAISGDCHPMGTVGLDDFELEKSESGNLQAKVKGDPLYRDMNGRVVKLRGEIVSYNDDLINPIESIEYPNNSDNLCDIKYYDGTIQNVSTTNNMTNIVYIPISDIPNGYDVKYDNAGSVTLDTIDSSSRESLIEVNGTTYKSLQTAINNAPSDSIINISGNYDTANRVVIPQNKSLTINYASGSRVNSYSKEPLVTNNGILKITGSGSSSIVGRTGFENNNTMTFSNGNFNNVYTQSNLVKNNADLTFDNVKSNGLDIISTTDNDEKINLTINNGEFATNTIYANNTNVTVKGGYFYSGESNENYEAYYADSTTEKEVAHTKQLFNAHDSIVTFDNFNVDDDTRYNNITNESNLGRFVNTTLNLNNSKFGGKSSKSRIYTTILNDGGKSIANINGGEYTNLRFTYRGSGNEYNQTSGIVNGSLLISGNGQNINITGGKISTNDDAILIKDGSGINVTVGTKGDLKPGTNKLNVSKTEPEIRGGTFGISETGSSYSQNNLYFYDGVFKASSNPIDAHIEDIETGYDVIYDNLKSPKEKYLDILPLVLNYTTGVYYYDAQEAFNAANTDDKLIWTRDYTNFADTPSLVIPAGKKFELYFSYGTAEYKPIYYRYYESDNPPTDPLTTTSQDEFEPYTGSGSFVHSGMTARQTSIRINNTSYVDENTGETIERPFIINNGDVTIYGTASSFGGGEPILDVMSRTSAIVNNGTLRFNRFSIRNVKSNKTMVENNGTMEIYRSDFVSYQSNVITNNGTLDFVGDDSDTNTCYIPTSIKVHSDQSLEDAINYYLKNPGYDIHSILSETIVNNQNATMNIKYLVVDSDYTYTVILNNGTLDIEYSFIETYKNDDVRMGVSAGKSIINNGEMTAKNLQSFTEKGILNTGTLDLNSVNIDAGYDTVVTNSGTLSFSGSIVGARTGIDDTGTATIYGYIHTYGEAYHGEGYNESQVIGGSLNTYGINTADYSVNYSIPISCTSSNDNRRTVSGSLDSHINDEYPLGYYNKNNAAVYLGENRTLRMTGGFIGLDGDMPIYHFCGYTYDGNYRHEQCSAPYPNGSGDGTNYNVAAVESNGGSIIMNGGTIYHGSDSDYKYAVNLYAPNWSVPTGSVTITSGYISKLYNSVGTVTMGELDNNANNNLHIASLSCRKNYQNSLNLYDGSVFLDKDNLCHFTNKEENYTIYSSSGGPYSLTNDTTVVINVDQDEEYSSVRTAISQAAAGDKLRFVNSVSEVTSDYDITLDKDITIDLNGNILDANVVINNGILTLTDEAYIADNEKEKGKLTNITVQDGTLNVVEGLVDMVSNSDTVNVSGGYVNRIDNGNETVETVAATLNVTGGEVIALNNYQNSTANIDNTTGTQYVNRNKRHSTASDAVMNITNSTISNVNNESISFTLGTGANISRLTNSAGKENNQLTLSDGKISRIDNSGYLIIDGSKADLLITIESTVTMNSGSTKNIGLQKRGSFIMNGGTVESLVINTYGAQHGYKAIINNGTVGSISTETEDEVIILGGEIGNIKNSGILTIGEKDGIVNTNSPKVINNSGYAISSTGNHAEVNIYDGFFKSNKSIVIDATINDSEPGYSPYVAPEYDELGVLTGKHIMYLKHTEELDTKIACVQGICYDTLQQAIDASVQNYTEQEGCPEVKIGDEFYFSVELTEDLVLDPQYSLTINLNYHNINDNGHTIPENITLRNGSRNGTDLQSNISKLLSNIFGINGDGKNIIITKMEDGNALDTSKTYNLYKFENGSYELQKVKSDGAGKYSIGRGTTDLKPIKGRIYINDLEAGEYKLEDNYNNEITFTIYDDGTLSPNIKENIISDYGHMSSSAVATLIITIQTGILKVNYALIALSLVIVLVVMFVLRKKSSSDN